MYYRAIAILRCAQLLVRGIRTVGLARNQLGAPRAVHAHNAASKMRDDLGTLMETIKYDLYDLLGARSGIGCATNHRGALRRLCDTVGLEILQGVGCKAAAARSR